MKQRQYGRRPRHTAKPTLICLTEETDRLLDAAAVVRNQSRSEIAGALILQARELGFLRA